MDKLLSDVLDSLKDESKKIAAELPSEEDLVILFDVIHEKLKEKTDAILASKSYVSEAEIKKLEKVIERLEKRLLELESKL
jgi:polyhydroxyalkanoate synthesis regulator phasin